MKNIYCIDEWLVSHPVKCYFAALIMNKRKKTYTLFQKLTAVFLMLTLVWLTVSAPFVATAQQLLAKQQQVLSMDVSQNDCSSEEDSGNNNIEEKVPVNTNLSEEYLHEHPATHHFLTLLSLYHKLENANSYTAFHGELLVPPPNAA